jgi:hypothetical protein
MPREWLVLSSLSEEDQQMLLDIHPSAPPLKFVSDYYVKLARRLLYYTRVGLCSSEEDKDWRYPLLVTLREKVIMIWRARALDKLEERREKRRGKCPGTPREVAIPLYQCLTTEWRRRILVIPRI